MNINLKLNRFNSITNIKTTNYFQNNNLNILQEDTVSFSGKKRKEVIITPNMQNSINMGIELYNSCKEQEFSYSLAEEKMQKNIPILSVDDIKNIPEEIRNPLLIIKAYLNPKYDDNGNIERMKIHISPKIETATDFSKIVHEYTHAQQRYNDDAYLGAFTLLNEKNITKARGLNGIATFVFNQYEARKGDNSIFKKAAKLENKGKEPEQALAEALGFKTVNDLKKIMQDSFDGIYDGVLKDVLSQKENITFIPFLTTPEILKNSVRKMCVKHAEMEYEAYEAQKQFLKKIDKHNMPDEIKMQPVFYKLMAEALTKTK